MDILFEIATFIGGAIFYSFKSQIGKALLTSAWKFAKLLLQMSEQELINSHERKQARRLRAG